MQRIKYVKNHLFYCPYNSINPSKNLLVSSGTSILDVSDSNHFKVCLMPTENGVVDVNL